MKENVNTKSYWDEKHSRPEMHPDKYAQGHHKNLFLKIVDKLVEKKVNRLLDVGSGNGHLYYHIKKQLRKMDYYGVDFSRTAIENTRAEWPELSKKLYVEDCSTLSYFKYNFFDAVVIAEVLEHLEDCCIFPTMAASWRVLKEGGSLIITVPKSKSGHIEHLRNYSRISLAAVFNGLLPLNRVKIEELESWYIAVGIKS